MKAWSAAVAEELKDWPQITLKSFFGFTALYRGRKIFGLLPRTRVFHSNKNAVAFRIDSPSRSTLTLLARDSRIAAFHEGKARWFAFELSSDRDLHDALDYLGWAFKAARISKKTQ